MQKPKPPTAQKPSDNSKKDKLAKALRSNLLRRKNAEKKQ